MGESKYERKGKHTIEKNEETQRRCLEEGIG